MAVRGRVLGQRIYLVYIWTGWMHGHAWPVADSVDLIYYYPDLIYSRDLIYYYHDLIYSIDLIYYYPDLIYSIDLIYYLQAVEHILED